MERDSFKSYVDQHRLEFDQGYTLEVDHEWDRLEQRLPKKSKRTWLKVAVLALMCCLGWWSFYQNNGAEPFELQEATNHYQPLIDAKLKIIQANRQEIDGQVWEDLQLMDMAYDQLKIDLKEQVDSDEVMQAIIENYRIKLDILDQILTEIEAKQDEKQQEHEISL